MSNMNELQRLLDKTKIALMERLDCAFFTNIVFSLKHVWDDTCGTAYTDYKSIGWDPKFFLELDADERLFVEIHEACHVAYDHMGRILGREHELWNIACDHAINLMLKERGFKMPKVGCADPRFKGMSAEDIYTILENERSKVPPNQMPDLRATDMLPEDQKRHVEDIIIRAATQAQMQGQPGSIPGEIQLFLDKLFKPKLPFPQLLRRYMTEFAKVDYSWRKPNRRFFPAHHLPSLEGRKVMDLDFYIDISGSVDDEQFLAFISEIAGVMKMMKPNKIRIVQFDTRIQHVDVIKSFADIAKLKFTGRGGTCIECIMEMIEAGNATLSMVFTDGGFNWKRNGSKKKILWLINDNPRWKPLFGSVLHFSTRDYVK